MSIARRKSLGLTTAAKSDGTPTAAQLALINTFTLKDFTADQLYTRDYVVCHNCIDRDNECFDEGLIANFAATLPGKGMFIKHPMSYDGDSGPAEGKWYAATPQTMSLDDARKLLNEPGLTLPPDRTQAVLLMASSFQVRTPDNATLITKLDAGIAGFISIGCSASAMQKITDMQGNELTAQRMVGPGEALEASLVWLGAQPGAKALKSATQSPTGETAMTAEETAQLAAEKAARTAAETQLKTVQPQAETLTAIKTALGADAPLLDNVAELKSLLDAGKAYRDGLVDDLVIAQRHKGLVKDEPAAVETAKATLKSFTVAQLKVMADMADVKTVKPGITGGDPQVHAGREKAAAPGTLAANPLFAAAA